MMFQPNMSEIVAEHRISARPAIHSGFTIMSLGEDLHHEALGFSLLIV